MSRDLHSKSVIADWGTFTCDAAVFHHFLEKTDNVKTKEIANNILKDKPEGDYMLLIEKLNQLESHPWCQPKNNLHMKSTKAVCEKFEKVGTLLINAGANSQCAKSLGTRLRNVS